MHDSVNKWRITFCLFLVIATSVVYEQVQGHEFLNYDDNRYVTENRNVTNGFSGVGENILWAFTTSHASNWHPVTWLSHMLDVQLFGLNPKGHHLTSLFFHIANALLLFLILARKTGAHWQSGFVAAMFALHPLNVEPVAWIAERKSVLSTFFWMLTLWAYIRYTENPNVKRYFLVVLFLALGLMSKPMLVTVPFILLLLDYWPLDRLKLEKENVLPLIREKIPLFVLVGISCVITFTVQKSGGAIHSVELNSLAARLNNALVSYMAYLQHLVWPLELAVFYPHPGHALSAWKGAASGMVLVCITFFAVRMIRRAPYVLVGWFWYLGTLMPAIGIVQVGDQAMADRYAYIPLIGIFIVIAWGLPELIAHWQHRKKMLAVSAGILISVLMALTWLQVTHWENSVKLFRHAVEVTNTEYPTSAVSYNNLGHALNSRGEFEEAVVHYRKAIRLNPGYAQAHNNLGSALSELMQLDEAMAHYREAIGLDPGHAEAYNNLGNAMSQRMQLDEAVKQYQEAIRINPGHAETYFNLGVALRKQLKFEEAMAQYTEAIRLKPDFPHAHNNLGGLLDQKGNIETAIVHYKEAIRFHPNYAEAHNNLGSALGQKGNIEEAIAHFETAVSIDPDYTHARNNLALALSIAGKAEEADVHLKKAKELPEMIDKQAEN